MTRILTALLLVACLLVPAAPRAAVASSPRLDTFPSEISLCPGQSTRFTWVAPVTQIPPKADFLFAVDTTGSMGQAILGLQDGWMTTLMPYLAMLTGSPRYAVVEFRDYPIDPYGFPDDYPYLLRSPFTDAFYQIQQAFDAMAAEGGGDTPEAYTRALFESFSDPALQWRTDARRYVIMVGDSVPHEPDPGPDGYEGTLDDLELAGVLSRLRLEAQPLLFAATSPEAAAFWMPQAPQTSSAGSAVLVANGYSVAMPIVDMVKHANNHLDRLALRVTPEAQAGWLVATPGDYQKIILDAPSTDFTFDLTLTIPPDAVPQEIPLKLEAAGDHVVFKTQDSTLRVVPCTYATVTSLEAAPNPVVPGEMVSFSAAVTSDHGLPDGKLTFLVDGADVPGCAALTLDASGQAACQAGPFDAGTYAVSAAYLGTDVYQASSQALAGGLVVVDTPIAGLLAGSDSPVQYGKEVHFSASTTGGTNVLYSWTFGDGQTGAGASVTHRYASAGDFIATLLAENSAGKTQAGLAVRVDRLAADVQVTQDFTLQNGDLVTFTLTVKNGGPDPSGSLRLVDAFPPAAGGLDYHWFCIAPDGCAVDGQGSSLAADLAWLAAGESIVIEVHGHLADAHTWSSTAALALDANTDDPDLANNTAAVQQFGLFLPGVLR